MRHQSCDRNADGRADRHELKLDRVFPQLLDAAGGGDAPVAHEGGRLPIPLRVDPIERVLQHRGWPEVVLGSDEDKAVCGCYLCGPSLDDLIRVRRATWRGRCHRFIEERHRIVAKVEQSSFDVAPLPEEVKDPPRWLLPAASLPRAPDAYGDDGHPCLPSY